MRARLIILRIIAYCSLAMGMSWQTLLCAAPITVVLPAKIVANADFREGDTHKPAVLVLHGFMATYNLNIVQSIAGELEGLGYTVLAPTLSLRINNRHTGANCEAIHTHTMETDVKEINWWINWLKHKGHRDIRIIGFSTGALQAADLLEKRVPKAVKKAILVSPIYMTGSPFPQAVEQADLLKASSLAKQGNTKLHSYSLSYCKNNFMAPAKVYLSYKAWTKQRLFEAIESIAIPVTVIVGGNDMRFGSQWVSELKSTGKRVIVIAGANHFFDALQEFDFLEKLGTELLNTK